MTTQQGAEADVLAHAVERMSQELADARIHCERYRIALTRIILDGDAEFNEGIEPKHTPYAIAKRALNP